jgi:two-component system KDP operon response regulator KdpE
VAKKSILVVDDEPQIQRALRVGLAAQGYEVTAASSGEAALDCAAGHEFDIVILDLGLPGMDGVAVCRALREWTRTPILVLSVRSDEAQKIAALDAGADDYITKPFGMGELLARIRAALRRTVGDDTPAQALLTVGPLVIDFARRIVTRESVEVHLTPTEYALLKYLAGNADRVLTHRAILNAVWGAEYSEEYHYLRVFVRQLRQKIEPDPSRPRFILTESGVGYRFVAS